MHHRPRKAKICVRHDSGGSFDLDLEPAERDNLDMVIPGHIHNGVVVLDGGLILPEGMQVTVSVPVAPATDSGQPKRRVSLPLVASKHPGSLDLTSEGIAELLDDDDVPA